MRDHHTVGVQLRLELDTSLGVGASLSLAGSNTTRSHCSAPRLLKQVDSEAPHHTIALRLQAPTRPPPASTSLAYQARGRVGKHLGTSHINNQQRLVGSMDSPQKKLGLGSMDGEMPQLLPASVTVAKRALADRLFEDEVQLVSAWALFTAFVFFVNYAIGYAFDHYHVPCSQSFFLRCNRLTDAEAAKETALVIGMLCCAALQAVAVALALRLPCRRPWVRHTLAFLALALTIGGHCLYARGVRLNLAADPEDVYYKIFCNVAIVVFGAGDFISFLALLAD